MVTNKSWLKTSRSLKNLAVVKYNLSEISSNMLEIVNLEGLSNDSEPMQIAHEINEFNTKIDALNERLADLYYSQYTTLLTNH